MSPNNPAPGHPDLGPVLPLTLAEVAEAIAAGRLTSREVTQACIDRVNTTQGVLNSFIALEAEDALAAAEAADAELARSGPRGPLHGVPMAHKDMFYRAGKQSSCGSKVREGFVPDVTCTLIERLEAAGAIHLGRLNMTEFATGPHGLNVHFGNCNNPWGPSHITGGSSSGSGASVAARQVFGALGSDTGGSVRLPSIFCGVTGIKPTQHRVSRANMLPLSYSMDQAGPLARTARDCARILGIIAGHDPLDPTSSTVPVPDYESLLGRELKGTRIGVPSNHYVEGATDEVLAALAAAREIFAGLGAEVVDVTVPDHEIIGDLANMVVRTEAAAIHRRWLSTRPGDYSPQVRARIGTGMTLPATRYLDTLNLRTVVLENMMREVFAKVDVMLTPGALRPAPTQAELDVGDGPGYLEVISAITRCTQPINYLGLPGLCLPAGFSATGLPLSIQLVGRPFGEARLLNMGDAFQQATGWHTKPPPV